MTTTNSAAEWINAISVVVLVGVTWYYARTTRKILSESEKMRKAAENQAASAASQASAANATLQHLREQVEELSGLGNSIVRTTIDSVVRSIEDWKKLDIKGNFGTAYTFPPPSDLIPENAQIVTEHARRISEKCAILLTAAFDDLRSAQGQIEILRKGSENPTRQLVGFNPAKYDPGPYLTSAFAKLQDARKFVN
jgi:hypothetical protein